jgi:POT family proton-dependent oligopeptide transporter
MIIMFAPVFSWLWVSLARSGRSLPLAGKFAAGLLLLGSGFLVMYFAARLAVAQGKVLPVWLISTYLLHTWGELALSPVGLSAITKLAPARLGAQAVGVWFLASALGNLLSGVLGGMTSGGGSMAVIFLQVAIFAGALGLLLARCTPYLSRLTQGVE